MLTEWYFSPVIISQRQINADIKLKYSAARALILKGNREVYENVDFQTNAVKNL